MKKWLRKLLGLDEIEARLDLVEREKSGLELRVVEANTLVKHAQDAALEGEVSDGLKEFIESQRIELSDTSVLRVTDVLSGAMLIERYGFRRAPALVSEQIDSPIITIADLEKNPELYYPRLAKGFLEFPIGLNMGLINNLLASNFGWREVKFREGINSDKFMIGYDFMLVANKQFVEAMNLSQLNRDQDNHYLTLDPLDFFLNYASFERVIVEQGLSKGTISRAISALRTIKLVYISAMEIIGTTRIRDPQDLLDPDLYKDQLYDTIYDKLKIGEDTESDEVKTILKRALLNDTNGTTYHEVQKLLEMRSKELFVELASQRTAEIIVRDKEYGRLTSTIGKPINEYTVGESIMLACYFQETL